MKRASTAVSKQLQVQIPPILTYHKILTQIKLDDDNVLVVKHVPFDFTEEESNATTISQIIEKKTGLDSPILLDSEFKVIKDTKLTRGELYWGANKKIFYIARSEFEKNMQKSSNPSSDRVNYKKIIYPVEYDNRPRPKSVSRPVTGPRTFRQCLTKLNIDLDNKLVFNDHVPFDMNEDTANVNDIRKMIKKKCEMKDPVLLDMGFKQINDSIWTRGEFYWNHKRKYYFIEREDWNAFRSDTSDCKFFPATYRDNSARRGSARRGSEFISSSFYMIKRQSIF